MRPATIQTRAVHPDGMHAVLAPKKADGRRRAGVPAIADGHTSTRRTLNTAATIAVAPVMTVTAIPMSRDVTGQSV